jgi:DNA-directed RNA polymerase subunit alpha
VDKTRLLVRRSEPTYGEFVLEPLSRGFGVTIGNPLRRILMSSIRGTAVTSVYIEDVLHEFQTIEGVTEDVIQIILNLKELVVKFHTPGPKNITLRIEGPCVVTGADLDVPSDAEVVNKDQHIATLAKGAKMLMEIRVEDGVGYVTSERHATKDRINSMPVDAVYNPIRRVAYHVEDTRVGQSLEYERLTMRVWSDGSINPKDALDMAVRLLRQELDVFSAGSTDEAPYLPIINPENGVKPTITPPPPPPPPPSGVSLEGLGLTTRVLHSLKEEGIDSVEALLSLSDKDLKKVPGVGDRSLDEIKKQLAQNGLYLKDN